MPMKLLDIWINCPDRATARAIGEALVERRLAACVNLYPEIESIYRWQGQVERAREVPLLVKTRPNLFAAVAEAARALHPDDTPAIHALEAAAVSPDYLAWVRAETEAGTADR
jgi:periplasmic divalent cation tolerance protein